MQENETNYSAPYVYMYSYRIQYIIVDFSYEKKCRKYKIICLRDENLLKYNSYDFIPDKEQYTRKLCVFVCVRAQPSHLSNEKERIEERYDVDDNNKSFLVL